VLAYVTSVEHKRLGSLYPDNLTLYKAMLKRQISLLGGLGHQRYENNNVELEPTRTGYVGHELGTTPAQR